MNKQAENYNAGYDGLQKYKECSRANANSDGVLNHAAMICEGQF